MFSGQVHAAQGVIHITLCPTNDISARPRAIVSLRRHGLTRRIVDLFISTCRSGFVGTHIYAA